MFNAEDVRKGPKRWGGRIHFPKVCGWRLKAQTLTLQEGACFGWVCCLHDWDTKAGGGDTQTDGRQKLSPCEEKQS